MPKLSRENRSLKRVLEWVLNRDIVDAEIAAAIGKPSATYSRRKDAEDFPTYEELDLIGGHFGVNPRWLQVEFGYLGEGELNATPHPTSVLTAPRTTKAKGRMKLSELAIRTDAPPLGN